MEPIFTDKQLNNMSREDLISLMKIVQEQTKKKDTEIQLLKDKQMNLFNEAEANVDAETEELFEEIQSSSYKRKKRKGKKEEDLSNFETVETRTYLI